MLHELYDQVYISQSTWRELIVGTARYPSSYMLSQREWLHVEEVELDTQLARRLQHLDPAEIDSIALAIRLEADLLLIDERLGTHAAREMGFTTTGAVGVLLLAKEEGLIDKIGPVLHEMRTTGGFRLHDRFVNKVLRDAGER